MERVVVAIRSVAVALLALVFVHQADTATTAGDAIFRRAEAVALSDAHARYATYAVTVAFDNGRHHVVDTWDTNEDLTDAVVLASIFSREERANPAAPAGTNLRYGLSLGSGGGSVPATWSSTPVNASAPRDPIGPVAFAVDQNFGLTAPRAYTVVHDVASLTAGTGLEVIGRAGATAARYRVDVAGSDGTVNRLTLVPLRDPYHNRLRELWVDDATAFVRQAIVQGVGDRAPLDRARWKVTFVRVQGGTYVARAEALEPIDFGRAGRLTGVTLTFDELALSATSPFRYTFGISTPVSAVHDP